MVTLRSKLLTLAGIAALLAYGWTDLIVWGLS